VLEATSNEYAIAVTTPSHSKTRDLFMVTFYLQDVNTQLCPLLQLQSYFAILR
jgi:hypothetical protein